MAPLIRHRSPRVGTAPDRRPTSTRAGWHRVLARHGEDRPGRYDEDGLTLVEVLIAFIVLIVLLTVVGTALSSYLNAGTSVVSSYTATDQLLPSSVIIQRLIRAEVEPEAISSTTSAVCPTANTPCPPFLLGTTTTAYSTAFYANIGDPNGPAKIVMSSSTPTKCLTCRFYTSTFTVTQYAANSGTCPFSVTSTATCTWSSSGKILVNITGVVNGQTNLPNASLPIFTYNTLNPSTTVYTPNVPVSSFATGTCTSVSACPADNVQSVEVDIQVQVQGTPLQENDFLVYRLSSFSYLYSPLVG
jgi:hypothetical protein